MNATDLLDETKDVLTLRNAAYGEPLAAMTAIATLWPVTLGWPISPAQVELCMIDLKLARLARNPQHRDSAIDAIGYTALLPEVTQ